MQYGCIGEHLIHSFSAEIHRLIGDYEYTLREVPRDELDIFMREKNFLGINVTIPYKQDVIPYLDYISDDAREIGAVNTIVNREGKLCGYNTDFFGMRALIRRTGIDPSGKTVLIAGTGGTSKTAEAVAKSMGAKKIVKMSRSKSGDAITYEDAEICCSDAAVLINATPAGMFPKGDTSLPLNLKSFPMIEGVVDAVYNPLHTNLVTSAKEMGIAADSGLYMLVAQAVAASEIFFDKKYPERITESIYKKIYQEKENIILVGMPGSGKTTAGKIIAKRLSKKFIDTDKLIVKKAGKSIPDIFREDGEAAFRDIEAEVIREVSTETNLLISTGGGAVMRGENVEWLRRGGKIYFLDRAPDSVKPDGTRPLITDEDSAIRLYNERIDTYRAVSDFTVEVVDGDIEFTVSAIIGDFKK